MSDETKTDNPYQALALSDEPLGTKENAKPKARLNPVHRLLPIFGYVYIPAIFIFDYLVVYNRSQEQYGIAGTLVNIEKPLKFLIGSATDLLSSDLIFRLAST